MSEVQQGRPMFSVQNESLPEKCEICHQTDMFDPVSNMCHRCGVQQASIGLMVAESREAEASSKARQALSSAQEEARSIEFAELFVHCMNEYESVSSLALKGIQSENLAGIANLLGQKVAGGLKDHNRNAKKTIITASIAGAICLSALFILVGCNIHNLPFALVFLVITVLVLGMFSGVWSILDVLLGIVPDMKKGRRYLVLDEARRQIGPNHFPSEALQIVLEKKTNKDR